MFCSGTVSSRYNLLRLTSPNLQHFLHDSILLRLITHSLLLQTHNRIKTGPGGFVPCYCFPVALRYILSLTRITRSRLRLCGILLNCGTVHRSASQPKNCLCSLSIFPTKAVITTSIMYSPNFRLPTLDERQRSPEDCLYASERKNREEEKQDRELGERVDRLRERMWAIIERSRARTESGEWLFPSLATLEKCSGVLGGGRGGQYQDLVLTC